MNWQHDKDYQFPENMSLHLWAWQFLRRNKEYQGQWEIACKHYAPDVQPSSLDFVESPSSCGISYIEALKDWGFQTRLYNPERIAPEGLEFRRPMNRLDVAFDYSEVGKTVSIRFDLMLPLPAQLDKAHTYLKELKKNLGKEFETRKHIDKWNLYLRVVVGF